MRYFFGLYFIGPGILRKTSSSGLQYCIEEMIKTKIPELGKYRSIDYCKNYLTINSTKIVDKLVSMGYIPGINTLIIPNPKKKKKTFY